MTANPLTDILTPQIRGILYLVYGVGSIVMTYLGAKGVVGADEMALWTGLGVFFGVTAASNVKPSTPVQ